MRRNYRPSERAVRPAPSSPASISPAPARRIIPIYTLPGARFVTVYTRSKMIGCINKITKHVYIAIPTYEAQQYPPS
jgi:hypothetical protein